MTATAWSREDEHAAAGEGWGIFDYDAAGQFQLQRLDDLMRFHTDYEAWRHVWASARTGNVTCQRALAFLAERNPSEYEAIRDLAIFGPARIASAREKGWK
jgi:hypothetical protein